ncbi:hypothetical protein, partial [Xenorhabdus eapokensis]|uniref:hypothetical protein n=1 Tax=Xenorhabdus eapokensis TaxID=1873482 RepID=UPI000A4DB6AF
RHDGEVWLFFGESNYTKSSCCLIIPHKTSTRPNVERKYVNSQDELLEAAENAAGGSLNKLS